VNEIAIEDLSEQPTGSPNGITLLPDFILGAMARRGPGIVEPVHLDSVRAPPTRWVFQPATFGAVETIAETRRSYFRTILARFGSFCGISPYGGEAELSVAIPGFGSHHFSIVLCNAQQSGFTVRISLHATHARTKSPIQPQRLLRN